MNQSMKISIKEQASKLGFDLCGIALPDYSPEDHDNILRWLDLGYNGDMAYLKRAPRGRYDPMLFFHNVRSIVVVGANYYKKVNYQSDKPYVSIYARGKPYQDVIRERLEQLLEYIQKIEPSAKGKIAVDTSPTSDKLWAQRAGIGWRGKNSLVINRKIGSFIFIGELFLNIELDPDVPETDHCANCNKCIEACPNGALEEPRKINPLKCISYLNDAAKQLPSKPEMIGNNIYGCDICQLICPYNKKAKETNWPEFKDLANPPDDIESWRNLQENDFESRYQGTIIGNCGFTKISANASLVIANIGNILNGS